MLNTPDKLLEPEDMVKLYANAQSEHAACAQIEYCHRCHRLFLVSLGAESNRKYICSDCRQKRRIKLRYILFAIAGAAAYLIIARSLCSARGGFAVGGEVLLLFAPLDYYFFRHLGDGLWK